jgi:hypothetical protein
MRWIRRTPQVSRLQCYNVLTTDRLSEAFADRAILDAQGLQRIGSAGSCGCLPRRHENTGEHQRKADDVE